jgi:hypothetical protein
VAAGDASGIEQVWVTYSADGEVWRSLELIYSAYTDRWERTLPAGTEEAVFIVQAMDGAGNTGHSGNKGRLFGATDEESTVFLPLILSETGR